MKIGRIWVIVFAFIGLAIAWQPFDTIFDMGKLAFSGLAVLFPVTVAVLHWKKMHNTFAIASIIIGELLLIGFYYKWLPADWLMGFESFIIVIGVCFGINILGRIFIKKFS